MLLCIDQVANVKQAHPTEPVLRSTPREMPKAKAKKDASNGTAFSNSKTAPAVAFKPQPPRWPPFSTLLPASDLALTPLLDDQIITVPNFWTVGLCKSYVSFLSTLPLATTPGKPKKGEAVRANDRFQVNDATFAERLWSDTALKDLVLNAEIGDMALNEDEKRHLWGGDVLGLNSNIRVYRYRKGQFFDQHCKSCMYSFLLLRTDHIHCKTTTRTTFPFHLPHRHLH